MAGYMVLSPKERLRRLGKNWADPHWWRNTGLPGLREELARPLRAPAHQWYELRGGRHDFIDADWDTLVLLDCCRLDALSDTVPPEWESEMEHRISPGSATMEWLRRTFTESRYPEIVYTTANPQLARVNPASFAAVNHVWDSEWDDELNTVPPEATAAATKKAHEAHPNKRHIVHFLQPHAPFIGPTASRESLPTGAFGGGAAEDITTASTSKTDVYEAARNGKISTGIFQQAYQETLEKGIAVVERLINNIQGKVVVSSDHGELIGERTPVEPWLRFGHAAGRPTAPLIKVPWVSLDRGSRRDIVPTDTVVSPEVSSKSDQVSRRLEALGYRE